MGRSQNLGTVRLYVVVFLIHRCFFPYGALLFVGFYGISYIIQYSLRGIIAPSPGCPFYQPKPSDSAALPGQIDTPRYIVINYGIH